MPAQPVPALVWPDMWLTTTSVMTETPAARQVSIMALYSARVPSLDATL